MASERGDGKEDWRRRELDVDVGLLWKSVEGVEKVEEDDDDDDDERTEEERREEVRTARSTKRLVMVVQVCVPNTYRGLLLRSM